MKPKGYLSLTLHAHLPYVRHPEYPDFLEEDWLYEGINETYLPLLGMFEKFIEDGVDFRITMSITPPLANMLSDGLLQSRFYQKLNSLIELTEKEAWRTRNIPEFHSSALMYEKILKENRRIWEKYHGNILTGFKNLQDAGKLEIITCCATHGFLPLKMNRSTMKAQIKVAVSDYERHFDRKPRGMWLSECAYLPGIDEELKKKR
jgi:1,4-alpha-glucan branching enzyme